MKTRYLLLLCFNALFAGAAFAQQGFPVTDQQPVVIEGLSCGYRIKSLETKKVSDKGDFSRYSISFFVKNITGQPRVLPFRPGINGMNGVADNLVQFNCLNATGARLTSKYAVVQAPPYNLYRNGGVTKMGYAIMPGQTITVDEVMIVPLNEPLNILVFYIGYSQQLVPLTAMSVPPPPQQVAGPDPNQPPPVFNAQSFYQVKNTFNSTFINVQTGVISSSNIKNDWWSAQWQIVPVPGTSFVKLKNRWKANFICTDRGYVTMTNDDQSAGNTWVFESSGQGSSVWIKNVQSGGYLTITGNQIKLSAGMTNNPAAVWIIQ